MLSLLAVPVLLAASPADEGQGNRTRNAVQTVRAIDLFISVASCQDLMSSEPESVFPPRYPYTPRPATTTIAAKANRSPQRL